MLNGLDITVITTLVVLFLVKMLDNAIRTGNTIFIQLNNAIGAAITTFLMQIVFYKIVTIIVNNSKGDIVILVVATAGSLGTYIAVKINNKKLKESIFTNTILSDNSEAIIKLQNYLMNNQITSLTTDVYAKGWNKTIAIIAYTKNREESKLLDRYINESNDQFERIITNH